MSERVMSASQFKAHCLAVLDEVAATGEPVVVTKRGKPVARVVSFEPPPSLQGTARILVSEEELMAPIEMDWELT